MVVLLPQHENLAFLELDLVNLPARSWVEFFTSGSLPNRYIIATMQLTNDYFYIRDFLKFEETPVLNSFLDLHLVTYKDSPSWKVFGEVDKAWGNGNKGGPDSEAVKQLKQTIYDNFHPVKAPIDLQVERILFPIDSRAALSENKVNSSNIVIHENKVTDISNYTRRELIALSHELTGEALSSFHRLEKVQSLYRASAPVCKLFYPEPMIASPSKTHTDIAYIHILQYQYWLWFIFCFIIVFFFISFLSTVRWCGVRTQPRRETRGVSRSKCGDMITASVPVTWAISIIVSETTDAVDYYDGFGTGELVVGIRAFQWGWEYYYPRNIDLSYNVRPSYSTFIGNSVKHNVAPESTTTKANVWRYYQNRSSDEVVSPAHLLLLPLDNTKLLNFTNFEDIGAAHTENETAFKRVRVNSKVYNTNLIHTPSNLSSKYSLINKIQSNEGTLNQSTNYGISRQHTLTSIAATTSTHNSYLDSKSVKQLLESNYNYYNSQANLDVTVKPSPLMSSSSIQNVDDEVNLLNSSSAGKTLEQGFKSNPNVVSIFNRNPEKKAVSYPVRKIMNNKLFLLNKKTLHINDVNLNTIQDSNVFNDLISNSKPSFMYYQKLTPALMTERSVRSYKKHPATKPLFNLTSSNNSALKTINDNLVNTGSGSLVDYFYKVQGKWLNRDSVTRLAGDRLFISNNTSPFKSNSSLKSDTNFDTFKGYKVSVNESYSKIEPKDKKNLSESEKIARRVNVNFKVTSKGGAAAQFLLGDRERPLPSLTWTHWTSFWANSHIDSRLSRLVQDSKLSNYAYLPDYVEYADYDFRNESALEFLEDAFWETSYSGYSHYDYLNLKERLNKAPILSKKFVAWSTPLKQGFHQNATGLEYTKFEEFPTLNPVLQDKSVIGSFYTNSIQSDDLVTSSPLLNRNDFLDYAMGLNIYDMEDSYVELKGLTDVASSKFGTVFQSFNPYQSPLSYTSVLDMFRSDYEDVTAYVDLNNNTKVTNLLNPLTTDNVSDNSYSTPTARFSEALSLRKTAQNSIKTYSAYQKVLKPRFESGANLTNVKFFSDLAPKQAFLTGGRLPYESLLGKNRESFYNTTFYNPSSVKFGNFVPTPTNTYFFELPFLTGAKHEATRYFWFDGYSRWCLRDVQGSNLGRNSLLGVPYSRRHFDYTAGDSSKFSMRETYFSRLTRARKNYVNQWIYTPYLTLRNGEWLSTKLVWDELTAQGVDNKYSNQSVKSVLSFVIDNRKSLMYHTNTSSNFHGTNSMNNLYIRSTWRPSGGSQSYFYNVASLVDILSRREFLYRQYFTANSSLIHLPKILTATPQNPLLKELKSSYVFLDPITYTNEFSRDFYYHSLNFFKFIVFRDTLLNLAKTTEYLPINWSLLTEYLFFYLLDTSRSKTNNSDLYKNQFRPLKKGINNMLRLHATGAIAMPIELRLQILASSRDVIHSWAIPSAGIKIDCIPGYTSHRIMIFLVAGIYWGQCMEICGRYHHWMPIVAYFMKRDLFFLWCTHFIFKSAAPTYGLMNDRQYADYLQFISYDKASWLNEVAQREL